MTNGATILGARSEYRNRVAENHRGRGFRVLRECTGHAPDGRVGLRREESSFTVPPVARTARWSAPPAARTVANAHEARHVRVARCAHGPVAVAPSVRNEASGSEEASMPLSC